MELVQALLEYTFRPADDAEPEISILELDPVEFDAELEEPVDDELEPVEAELDPPVAVGKPLPTLDPEAPITAAPFAVFKREDPEALKLKLEVAGEV